MTIVESAVFLVNLFIKNKERYIGLRIIFIEDGYYIGLEYSTCKIIDIRIEEEKLFITLEDEKKEIPLKIINRVILRDNLSV